MHKYALIMHTYSKKQGNYSEVINIGENKMKKVLAVLLTLAMIFSFAACGGEKGGKVVDNPYGVINPGKLTIATSPDFAPYEFYTVDAAGNYTLAGFDPAMAKYVADYLGLELDVIPMDFDGCLAELASKNVDCVFAGLSPDPDRMDNMDFSDIYYKGGQSFCVAKANENLFASLADTNDAKYQIGAQNGSIQMDLAMENSPNADVVAQTKVTEIIADLLAGNLDGAYIETAVAETYAVSYPDLIVKFDVPYDVAGSAVGVVKGNEALLKGVNEAVAKALADGSMDKFVAQANEDSTGNIFEGIPDAK